MRVAFLTSAYGPGDGVVGRHVQALAAAVARSGGAAEVLLYGGDRGVEPDPEPGLHVTCFPRASRYLRSALSRQVAGHLRRHGSDWDLLHVHGRSVLPAAYATLRTSVWTIFTPHYYAQAPAEMRRLAQDRSYRLDRHFIAAADVVLCVSRSEALHVSRYTPEGGVEVISSGIDVARIAAARPLPVDGRVILCIERLSRWTGIHRVISALPALSPAYRLTIIGRGRSRNMLEAHADYLRVGDRVQFLGPLSDELMLRWLRSASVVVTLKEESLWGGILPVAAAAGTPVVASDLPAYREAAADLGQEDVRFVSRRASPFAVAEAIHDQALAGSRPARLHVPTRSDMAEQTLTVYRRMIAQSRAVERSA